MIPHWLLEGRTLRILSKAILSGAVLSAVSVLVCLGRLYWSASQARSSETAIKANTAQLAEIDAQIEQAAKLKIAMTPASAKPLVSFQSATDRAASQQGVLLTDFTVNPESQVYLSKYTNDSPPAGWQQVLVRLTLAGRIQDIVGTLSELRKTEIPFEIDQVDVSRAQVDSKTGNTAVSAQIQLRVLMRG